MKLYSLHRPVVGVFCLIGVTLNAHAGGFALIEHGASGLGNAYAGASAVSVDTSTVWFNPAGMTELSKREIGVAAHIIGANTDFEDRGSSINKVFGATPFSDVEAQLGITDAGLDTASPGGTTLVPNFYYVAPINNKLSYGLGIAVPFGSSTEYDADWRGRYQTVESAVTAIDINPSIAYRVSDKVRLGAGISIQKLSVTLENAVDSGAVCLGAFNAANPALCPGQNLLPGIQANDSYASVTGDSTSVSFNIGALFLPREGTKIGVSYRHSNSHSLDGDVDFTVDPKLAALLPATGLDLFQDGGVTSSIDLPATLSFSLAQKVNDKIQLLADATWTGWSSFEEIRINFNNPDQPDSFSVQDWEDVWRLSAGLNYQHNEKLTLRTGIAFDQEPIPGPARRTPRIPGNDRTWIAFGVGYKATKKVSFDLGFTHLFLDETPIDNENTESAIGSTVRGLYTSGVNIVSAQLNWHFN